MPDGESGLPSASFWPPGALRRGSDLTGTIRAMPYIIGIDTGGTFTDCVVMDADGRIVTAKASSTPVDFSEGVHGRRSASPARQARAHHRGAAARHRAAGARHHRRHQRACSSGGAPRSGSSPPRGTATSSTSCAARAACPASTTSRCCTSRRAASPIRPSCPSRFIAEVSERVDCKGQVVVELNEEEAERGHPPARGQGRRRPSRSASSGRSSIAEHERRVKAMVERLAPGVFVCCSADLIPRWGEYERTVATVHQRLPGPGHVALPRPARVAARRRRGCATRCRSCSAAAA